jgi:hypothetical protein
VANTVIGLFDEYGPAERALLGLLSERIGEDRISILAAARSLTRLEPDHLEGGADLVKNLKALVVREAGAVVVAGPLAQELGRDRTGSLAAALGAMGIPPAPARYYAEGVRLGGILLAVLAADEDAAGRAADILWRQGPVDLQKRIAAWRQGGYIGPDADHPGEHAPGGRADTDRRREQPGVHVYSHDHSGD